MARYLHSRGYMNCENVASVKRFSMLPLVRCPDAMIQAVIGAFEPLHPKQHSQYIYKNK